MILLDTNSLLWVLHGSTRLGTNARQRIDDAGSAHYSAISTAEISIKHLLARLPLPGGDLFPSVLNGAGLRELPFTSAHAAAMLRFPALVRHDPFDRMILAQAEAEGMTLLTADRTLLALGQTWIVDARV